MDQSRWQLIVPPTIPWVLRARHMSTEDDTLHVYPIATLGTPQINQGGDIAPEPVRRRGRPRGQQRGRDRDVTALSVVGCSRGQGQGPGQGWGRGTGL